MAVSEQLYGAGCLFLLLRGSRGSQCRECLPTEPSPWVRKSIWNSGVCGFSHLIHESSLDDVFVKSDKEIPADISRLHHTLGETPGIRCEWGHSVMDNGC